MPEETPLLEGAPFNPYRHFHNALVPAHLLQSTELSHGAKLLYGLLRKYSGKDGACFPLQSTLARQMGCAQRTVRTYVAELKRTGLLKLVPRGKGRSASYRFLWKNSLNPSQLFIPDGPPEDALSGRIQPTEEVPLSGSLNRNSSSRGCGNVENFNSAPVSEASREDETPEGKSEQAGTTQNGDGNAGKLARAGWRVVMLGNGASQDSDVSEGLQLRRMIQEMAYSKRVDQRSRSF